MRLQLLGLLAILCCTVLVACQDSSRHHQKDDKRQISRIEQPQEAIRAFQSFWKNDLLPRLTDPKSRYAGALTPTVQGAGHLSAQLMPLRECHLRVDDTLTTTERQKLIFHGSLKDLDQDGQCWAVGSFGNRKSEVAGYLDPNTGKVLFVWMIPEG